MVEKMRFVKLALCAVLSVMLLSGCGDTQTWQEKLCINAIKKVARYGYEIHSLTSQPNQLITDHTDVLGTATIEDGFGAGKRESFRCSIDNDIHETPREEYVRVWVY